MPPGWCGTSVTPAPSSSAPRSTDSEADREVLLRTRSLTAATLDERPVLLAIGLLGALWGIAVAAGGLTSFYLCATLIACSLIVVDFRIGVVLLILLMPISGSSTLFPHEMFGVVGLNPLNLLLAGTLFSCLLHAAAERSLPQFLPQPLLWLYIVPIVIAGAIGSRHIHEIAPALLILFQGLDFANGAAYLREWVAKPLLMVVFALLVGAAVAKSARPEKLLIPVIMSMCVMAVLVPVYVAHSGMSLNQLASSEAREFLSPLGMHANDFGRLYASAVALALFTWSDSGSRGMGLTGLVLLCAYFAHAWRGLRALANDPHIPAGLRGFFQGAAAGLVGMLISDFTDSSLTPRPEQAFLWLAIGMMYGYRGRQSGAADIAQDESAQDEPAQDEPRGGRT